MQNIQTKFEIITIKITAYNKEIKVTKSIYYASSKELNKTP